MRIRFSCEHTAINTTERYPHLLLKECSRPPPRRRPSQSYKQSTSLDARRLAVVRPPVACARPCRLLSRAASGVVCNSHRHGGCRARRVRVEAAEERAGCLVEVDNRLGHPVEAEAASRERMRSTLRLPPSMQSPPSPGSAARTPRCSKPVWAGGAGPSSPAVRSSRGLAGIDHPVPCPRARDVGDAELLHPFPTSEGDALGERDHRRVQNVDVVGLEALGSVRRGQEDHAGDDAGLLRAEEGGQPVVQGVARVGLGGVEVGARREENVDGRCSRGGSP